MSEEELKCSVCVVACDVVQYKLRQVKLWTESAIMDAFESASVLMGEQYGYSDAQGYPEYIQRGKKPVATGLKIRTEFQDQVRRRRRAAADGHLSHPLPPRALPPLVGGRSG